MGGMDEEAGNRPEEPLDISGPPLPPPGARSPAQMRRAHRLESLGRLAGGIAHDFNNVLGVILGYVELAKMNMDGVDPKALRHLDLALNTLGRARMLADRLLDFAREERRAADVSSLNEAVQAVRELLAETLERNVKFEVQLGREVPPSPLSEAEMCQALENLCLNAAQAMPAGGRITVETWGCRLDDDQPSGLPAGRYAAVRVRDTGPGIPRDLRERIFDPYFTTDPNERSGLGLWVVRSLAERYGGRVEVDGGERGSAFTIWLPCELDVTPARGQADAREPVDDSGRSVDVLLVEDEPGMRDVTRGFLEMDGYQVVTAATGAEAEARLQEHAGDVRVVLLDHRLPDAKGAELAWKIHQMADAPRIVMITGMAHVPETEELPEGTRVLAKPFLHDDVSRLLRDDLGIQPHPAE